MGSTLIVAAVVAISTVGQSFSEENRKNQDDAFQQWWGTDFEWKFDDLPTKGSVPEHRMPYSGYIYPDTAGGTVSALTKYDRAFNGNQYLATRHERWDTSQTEESPVVVRGLFRQSLYRSQPVPSSSLVRALQRLDGGDDSACPASAQRGSQRCDVYPRRH